MRMTRAAQYALHFLSSLAARPATEPLASHEVAEACGLPGGFLLKVLRPLVNAGILNSLRGPTGGYRLAKRPEDVTLLDILEAVDGPFRTGIPQMPELADAGVDRRLGGAFDKATNAAREQLSKVRLADLVGKRTTMRPALRCRSCRKELGQAFVCLECGKAYCSLACFRTHAERHDAAGDTNAEDGTPLPLLRKSRIPQAVLSWREALENAPAPSKKGS